VNDASTRPVCSVNDCVDAFVTEHLVILDVVSQMRDEAMRLRNGSSLRSDFWLLTLGFLEHFVDHHHAREAWLFRDLAGNGVPPDGDCLAWDRAEHEQSRDARLRMTDALVAKDSGRLASLAVDFADCLRRHIGRENDVLFPLVRELLQAP
jgi:hemerythrin-like domain-containing protein